ncbi:glutathione S-transferase kappa 1-like [Saccoglossus kowalevskii]|uniref:Glutathione S-transferase kappa n=1 Tax=Saccoglossus kowalevskii TaxID=10224 RepID=A0ABM0GNB1_SACKO|nr:PREDICTED: glutathione S-transferase kappa 1-like [Saccoglossus kowalevskii]
MATPAKRTVEFFYDVISPYSWIAFEQICKYRGRWGIDLKFKPFLLGGVFKASGNDTPSTNSQKLKYIVLDMNRLAKFYKVPFQNPPNMMEMIMKGTLSAQRFIVAASMDLHDKATENISRQLWMRLWSKNQDATTPESLFEAARLAGVDENQAKKLLTRMKDSDVKDGLKQNTERALKNGAFGSPTILVHIDGKSHMFFGSDRFHIIAHIMGVKYEGPL